MLNILIPIYLASQPGVRDAEAVSLTPALRKPHSSERLENKQVEGNDLEANYYIIIIIIIISKQAV